MGQVEDSNRKENGKEVWTFYFVDERLDSALELVGP